MEWLKRKVEEKLDKHGKGKAFELFAKEILENLGFTNIKASIYGLDWDAEKGTKTGEDVVIRWSQLEKLWNAGWDHRIPTLMFVNYEGKWCLYKFFEGLME